MYYPKKHKKFNSTNIQVGQGYSVIGNTQDALDSQESKKELTKAQVKAQQLLQDALIQVEQTINNAQAEAAAILEQAKQDAVNIQAKAQETGQKLGYDSGYQAGFNQSIEETQNILASAETVINGAYKAQKEILQNTEKEMLTLVVAIAKKVIQKELKMQKDIILKITEQAIKELKDREVVKIMVNPEIVGLMQKASPILQKKITGLEVIKIMEDKSIPVGGVIVESPTGKIDGQIDTQLEEIYNQLLDEAATNPVLLNIPEQKAIPQENLNDVFNPKQPDQ